MSSKFYNIIFTSFACFVFVTASAFSPNVRTQANEHDSRNSSEISTETHLNLQLQSVQNVLQTFSQKQADVKAPSGYTDLSTLTWILKKEWPVPNAPIKMEQRSTITFQSPEAPAFDLNMFPVHGLHGDKMNIFTGALLSQPGFGTAAQIGCFNLSCRYNNTAATLGSTFHQNQGPFGIGLASVAEIAGQNNPFFRQPTYPSPLSADFQNTSWGSASSGNNPFGPPLSQVLARIQVQNQNYFSPFLSQTNNFIQSPWTSSRFGFLSSSLHTDTNASHTLNNSSVDDLYRRYEDLANLQLQVYFSDNDLSTLRSEWNTTLMNQLHLDPLYVYVSYALAQSYNNIILQTSHYNDLLTVATALASWTDASADESTLRQRYQYRQLYRYLQAVVTSEAFALIQSNQQLANDFALFYDYLQLRRQQNLSAPAVIDWEKNWQQRWNVRYETAASTTNLLTAANMLYTDYPALLEYRQLQAKIVNNLIPQFAAHPDVLATDYQARRTESSSSVSQAVNSYYDSYKTAVQSDLASTKVDVELEKFYALTNRLLLNDPIFIQMRDVQGQVSNLMLGYYQQVYQAVANCYQLYGNACDPYTFQPVVSLVISQEAIDRVAALGLFYEVVSRFWYYFYHTQSYTTLEQTNGQAVLQAIQPVITQISSQRTLFKQGVNDIQEVKQLNEASQNLLLILRGKKTGLYRQSGDTNDFPYSELDSTLTRMEQLAQQLAGGAGATPTPTPPLPTTTPTSTATPVTPLGRSVYLPVVQK